MGGSSSLWFSLLTYRPEYRTQGQRKNRRPLPPFNSRIMSKQPSHADVTKFIHSSQIGGIDAYTIDEGPARGVRALCVNSGGGLRYRVLVDRGLDIDQAFLNQHNLAFLTHKGVNPPTRALDRGFDWLKGFPGGLLVSCGPFNIGGPCMDAGQQIGLHGAHSNTAATIESVIQRDLRAGRKPHVDHRHRALWGVLRAVRGTSAHHLHHAGREHD